MAEDCVHSITVHSKDLDIQCHNNRDFVVLHFGEDYYGVYQQIAMSGDILIRAIGCNEYREDVVEK